MTDQEAWAQVADAIALSSKCSRLNILYGRLEAVQTVLEAISIHTEIDRILRSMSVEEKDQYFAAN